jgi:tetratricopeptide (TPR) repeat protein
MDISAFLNQWEYEPGKLLVRQFTGDDGLEKIQLRVDLGILQMNRDGRPDGKSPYDTHSYFDYLREQLEEGLMEAVEFSLDDSQLMELQQEALQYYHRYICLYELNEYDLVIRDTSRNLSLCDFIEEFANDDADISNLLNLKPQMLMMYAHSEAMILLQIGKKEEAIEVLTDCLEEIQELFDESDGIIDEPINEKRALEKIIREIHLTPSPSREENLKIQLALAVEKEDYEQAAVYRDLLKDLHSNTSASDS